MQDLCRIDLDSRTPHYRRDPSTNEGKFIALLVSSLDAANSDVPRQCPMSRGERNALSAAQAFIPSIIPVGPAGTPATKAQPSWALSKKMFFHPASQRFRGRIKPNMPNIWPRQAASNPQCP